MRKYAVLKHPAAMNRNGDFVHKVMIYMVSAKEVYVFLYTDAEDCSSAAADEYYTNFIDAQERCLEYDIAENDWLAIDDPLPFCQHDTVVPVRVKRRNIGKPEFGKLEILRDGKWADFINKGECNG